MLKVDTEKEMSWPQNTLWQGLPQQAKCKQLRPQDRSSKKIVYLPTVALE